VIYDFMPSEMRYKKKKKKVIDDELCSWKQTQINIKIKERKRIGIYQYEKLKMHVYEV